MSIHTGDGHGSTRGLGVKVNGEQLSIYGVFQRGVWRMDAQ